MYTSFYDIGDMIESDDENIHFHRDIKYQIGKIVQFMDKLIPYVIDKWGNLVPIGAGRWKYPSPALQKALYKRQFNARLHTIRSGNSCKITRRDGTIHDPDITYEVSFGSYYGGFSHDENPIGHVEIYKKVGDKYTDRLPRTYFNTDAEFYKYFEDLMAYLGKTERWYGTPEHNLLIEGISSDKQTFFDYQTYLNLKGFERIKEIESFDLENSSVYYQGTKNVKDYIIFLSRLIFDKQLINQNKEYESIIDILNLFKELPSSHGSTSVAKVLQGKSKIKNSKADPYFGKYPTSFLKYPQLFELCTHLEQYMWKNDIFITKESYSSSKEWRGSFEFIGSKHIDLDKYQKIIDEIKNIQTKSINND